jgi:hypothetical protein
MGKLDPQVQIKLIEIADKLSEYAKGATGGQAADLEARLQAFDKSYKKLVKTVTETEEVSSAPPKTK